MSSFDAAMRKASEPSKVQPKMRTLELWEVERWKLGEGWTETTWCDEEGVAASSTQQDMKPPSGYVWSGGWKIVPPEAPSASAPWQGFGALGWEYATSMKKLGSRTPRKGLAFDRARRRRWQRVAKKKKENASSSSLFSTVGGKQSSSSSGGGGASGHVSSKNAIYGHLDAEGNEIDRSVLVRRQLEQVQRLRRHVEARSKLCGTDQDTLDLRRELDEAAMRAGQLSTDVGKLLESSKVAAPLGSKLSRDLYKEVAAVAVVVKNLPPLPPQMQHTKTDARIVLSGQGGLNGSYDDNNKKSFPARLLDDDDRQNDDDDDAFRPPGGRQKKQMLMMKRPQDQKKSARQEEQDQETPEQRRARLDVERKVRDVSEQAVINSIEEETFTAVQEVHSSILQINDIVKDLAMQVEIQQEMIDAVDDNTMKAQVVVRSAREQVVQAATIQANTPCIIS